MSDHGEPHLPHGSIWPFWLAVAVALLAISVIVGPVMMVPAVLVLVVVLFGWFREDFRWWETNTGTGLQNVKFGTWLFIGSEIFIFGALFATYFTFRAHSTTWPDAEHLHLPLVKTGIFSLFLFASSGTIHLADKHIRNGNRPAFNKWWLLTILLGGVFLAGQVWEYATLIAEGHTLGSSQFMTSFYMITGTHGLHVFGGMMFLIIVLIRSMKGQFDGERHGAPVAASMYWHFVDVVWVFVFTTLYLLNANA